MQQHQSYLSKTDKLILAHNMTDNKRKQRVNNHVSNQIASNTTKLAFADICHKKTNGSNNWAKFKEAEKISPAPIDKLTPVNPENPNKKSKVINKKNWNRLKEHQIKPQVKVMNDKKPFSPGQSKPNNNHNEIYFVGHGNNHLNSKLIKSVTIEPEVDRNRSNEEEKTNIFAKNKSLKIENIKNGYKKFNELQIAPKPQIKTLNDTKGQVFSYQKKRENATGIRNIKPQFVNHGQNFNPNPKLTKCIAIDCEMVGVDEDAKTNMLARVSLVNSYGDCIYDKFVKPIEPVIDYRTVVSGVRPEDLENGDDFSKVQKEVAEVLKGRTLVGHALKNDMSVLFLTHPRAAMRDTSRYKKLQEGFKSTPSLKKLTAKYLGVNIQEGEHNSIEDAKAAMMLYMMFRKDWEAEFKRKRNKKMQTIYSSRTQSAFTCDDV